MFFILATVEYTQDLIGPFDTEEAAENWLDDQTDFDRVEYTILEPSPA